MQEFLLQHQIRIHNLEATGTQIPCGTLWGIDEEWEGDDEVTANHFRTLIKLSNKGQIAEKFAKFPYEFYIERMANGAVLSSSTGEVFVKRFRIKNWDKIKEGI